MSEPHVVFVCWGNICRSPMAEYLARAAAERDGVPVRFSSFGTSSEELGNPMDRRAQTVLRRRGLDPSPHRARQITADDVRSADLVIAAEQLHVDRLRRLVPDADNIALVTDFDPEAAPGDPLPDPWYGDSSHFDETLTVLDRAMPGILERVRQLAPRP